MKYYIGLVFACLIACLIPIFCQLFSIKDLWYESYAAIIGVVLTAIITFFLFKGQTSSEVQREKEAKVYEEKLQIYKDTQLASQLKYWEAFLILKLIFYK